MQQDIKNLYHSQVVMGESLNQLTQTVDKALKEIAAAQKHADERLDALILTVDEIIRDPLWNNIRIDGPFLRLADTAVVPSPDPATV